MVAAKGKLRRARGRRSNGEHYYTENPTSKEKTLLIKEELRGKNYVFETSAGLFSPKKIDQGTRVLIEAMKVGAGDSVLDLGCGYGPVGIVASDFSSSVTMTDVNRRALKYAKKNIERNKAGNAEIRYSNIYSGLKGKKFDAILVNPPISAGMQTCFQIINKAKQHLAEGGTLQLVARHSKGGSRLESQMEKVFGNVATYLKKGGFRVYLSRN